jgi:NAD(P)-dependent dehydrogenase (short-subunit alcohol dehydrogenase family)
MDMFRLEERVALVTGAASGIGQTVAAVLARAGAHVAISDRPGVALEETSTMCRTHGRKVLPLAMDVRDLGQIRRGVAAVEDELGRIDILVNNAGINHPTPGLQVELEDWEDHFQTNVRGGFFCAQAVAAGMKRRSYGRIIFISSQSGLIGIPGQPVYCATKGALINLVRSLGVEWARYGITVNSVAPTFVETNLTRQRLQDPEFLRFVLAKIPKGELATREDVAYAVLYLASQEAGMVNCFNLCVDGGWTAW